MAQFDKTIATLEALIAGTQETENITDYNDALAVLRFAQRTCNIKNEDINNILCSAFESGRFGIAYWCDDYRVTQKPPVKVKKDDPNYYAVAAGGELEIHEYDENEANDAPGVWHKLDHALVIKGIMLAAEDCNKTVRAFVDDCDGPGADLVLQFAVFDEQKYG